jgi:regulator of nucleoside diphosphate kinase
MTFAMEGHMPQPQVHLTDVDQGRLGSLLEGARQGRAYDPAVVEELQRIVEEAEVIPTAGTGPNFVTMNSEVRVQDLATGERLTFVVAFPRNANVDEGRISVLAPLGIAVLGRRRGERVLGRTPGGARRLRIEAIAPPGEREHSP